jgi:adenosylcobinamide-GDP ribazoletransferase
MGRLFAAVQFLTLIPARSDYSPARGAIFFPLIGALLGLAAAAIRVYLPLPPAIASLLALAFLVFITGALHEDGLADVADAFRAGRNPERILAILKDSRIGVYGAAALILTLLLRWQLIEHLADLALPALFAAGAASRGAMVVLAATSTPLGDGLGKSFCQSLAKPDIILVAIEAAAIPFLGGPIIGSVALAANVLAILAARSYFHARAGGITGDCLGAISQITEILTLLAFVLLRVSVSPRQIVGP